MNGSKKHQQSHNHSLLGDNRNNALTADKEKCTEDRKTELREKKSRKSVNCVQTGQSNTHEQNPQGNTLLSATNNKKHGMETKVSTAYHKGPVISQVQHGRPSPYPNRTQSGVTRCSSSEECSNTSLKTSRTDSDRTSADTILSEPKTAHAYKCTFLSKKTACDSSTSTVSSVDLRSECDPRGSSSIRESKSADQQGEPNNKSDQAPQSSSSDQDSVQTLPEKSDSFFD